jgi:oligopeptide transport system substrate-binding protein
MNSMRRLLIAGLLASTTLSGVAFAAGTHPVSGEPLADSQTFSYQVIDDFVTFDPQKIEDVDSQIVALDLFEGLTTQDAKGNLMPGVATEWTANADKTVYTFKLRPEAKWSNGDPVVAGDFVYGWQRAVDPALASPYAWFIELMAVANATDIIAGTKPITDLGVKAIDDHTFEVTLSQPIPYFPEMTVGATTFPAHRATIEKFGDDWTKAGNLVSNGAYVLTSWAPGEKMVRTRNPMYWDDAKTIITEVTAFVINDDEQALTRYDAGELDKTSVPEGRYPTLSSERPTEAHSVPNLCSYYYVFNMSESGPEAFKDVRVREALSLALDRDVIVDKVLQSGQIPAYYFTPNATAGFVGPDLPIISMSQADRDAKAVELMTEAGYGVDNPLSFELLYNTSEGHKKIAIAASQLWKQKLGVEVTLANQEWATFVEAKANQNFQLGRAAWCGDYNEASTFLSLYGTTNGQNDGKYSNAEIDQLLNEAQTSDNRADIYKKIEEIAAAETPVIPVYFYTSSFMLHPDVKGWPLDNIQQYVYSKNLYKVAE